LQADNSDIIMNIHKQMLALDGEPTLQLFPIDPEVPQDVHAEPFEFPEHNAKNTMNQVILDLNDIEALTQALASNQLFQKQSLETILEGVRELVQKELKKTEIKEDKEPLKNVYRTLYGSQDMKIISDKKLDNFRWSFVPLKDK
jgi:Asp-tRNA(Asn)/Glu-tRNA(Gln) amidotransferase B subunit